MTEEMHDIIDNIKEGIPTFLIDTIEYLVVDSRKIIFPKSTLFFALRGPRRDGHDFLQEVYDKGVRHIVISKRIDTSNFPDATFYLVYNVLKALQVLVAMHRAEFNYPVIGITGSNGKTIVKEWLYQLLNPDYNIVRSPRSYNSQIGVPLSVWQMGPQHNLAIFEAGISTAREMPSLAGIIQPSIGILTSIGEPHNDGFVDLKQKVLEKLQLFAICKQFIYCKESIEEHLDLEANKHTLFHQTIQLFSWSRETIATLRVLAELQMGNQTQVMYLYNNQHFTITVPFTDNASLNNVITCICTLIVMDVPFETIKQRILLLQPLEMRLQLKKGINNCHILNDSYSNDLSSLSIALDYLQQQAGENKTTVILSDILHTGLPNEKLYSEVATELEHRNINRLIGIGKAIYDHQTLFKNTVNTASFYLTIDDFLANHLGKPLATKSLQNEYILLKGARVFAFERISNWLEEKVHQTVMEINLTAMVKNLKQYQEKLLPTTKLMAMVKAFSYGSGSVEVARVLQFYKVDYLAVAYTDEGVELRQGGITLPIMVMNVEEAGFDALIEHHLEPEIYSFSIYHAFHEYLLKQGITKFPVHLKLNTGMNRLGFEPTEINDLSKKLVAQNTMVVKSMFSHLVASEAPEHDAFTKHQSQLFEIAAKEVEDILDYPFIKHIANSSGIFRHTNLQYDMVRLGIGLYGVDSADSKDIDLETVATLKTTIAQIRNVNKNETVGYNRRGVLTKDSKIATLRIGYADGYSRRLGNGIGHVYVNEQLAPIVGSVCMDMMMVDVTEIPHVKEGDSVELFGKHIKIEQVATWCNTIAYEIMTGVSQRVKRVYIEE